MDFSQIGRQFGLDEAQTRAAFEALAPVVAAGVRRNAASDGGLGDLLGAVLQGNHGRYLDDPSATEGREAVDDGNAILGHIFGSKDVSRGVAQQLSAQSGIGADILKKLLPVIAAMVMGQIAKKGLGGGQSSGGGLGDILGSVLGGGGPQAQSPGGGGLGDILGGVLGGALGGGQGSGGGLGDILGSVLGGGQQPQARPQAPQGVPGNLEDMLKDIFGGGGGMPAPQRQERISRSRKTLDDILGGGTSQGSAADDLLNSVINATRR